MNRFAERYKTFSNLELFSVLESAADYEPDAVEAAKAEVKERNVSDREWGEVKNEWEAEKRLEQEQEEKRTKVERKLNTTIASIFEAINPLQEPAPSAIKQIRWVTLVFGLISIFRLYREFGMFEYIWESGQVDQLDLSMITYVFPLVLLPVIVLLFVQGKKAGWILMAAYLSHSIVNTIALVIRVWSMEPFGDSPRDSFFPQMSYLAAMGIVFFFGGTLWVLSKKEIRAHFNISRRLAIGAILVVAALKGLSILIYIVAWA